MKYNIEKNIFIFENYTNIVNKTFKKHYKKRFK